MHVKPSLCNPLYFPAHKKNSPCKCKSPALFTRLPRTQPSYASVLSQACAPLPTFGSGGLSDGVYSIFSPALIIRHVDIPTLFCSTSHFYLLSLSMTSCAPPSTMLVEDTSVILAFCCNSGILIAPQLHIVDLTLLSVRFTLSFRLPA